MKKLVLALILVISQQGFAKTSSATESLCKSLSEEQIARGFLDFISKGTYLGYKKCNSDINWLIPSSFERDVYPNSVVLNPDDRIEIIGKPVEFKDEIGPLNIFEVEYVLIRNGKKNVKGKFTYTRVFQQHSIDEMGCASLDQEPSVAFIRKECVNK